MEYIYRMNTARCNGIHIQIDNPKQCGGGTEERQQSALK